MSNFNALPSLPLTHHAAYPRQQRGIPLKAIHACLDYGRLIHPGSGVEAYFLGRREILAIRKIDPVLADKQWQENTDQSKPRNRITGNPKHTRTPGEPSVCGTEAITADSRAWRMDRTSSVVVAPGFSGNDRHPRPRVSRTSRCSLALPMVPSR